ncbi:conserved hypothetical protein [Dinoroseobacter shibae DFL 12 = DSM 16493]|jgi:hypothetical protein|uniref:Lipoprotein n=1 Tax=Dinoroseobacter shibae (strain DSM 16493 / NCIMB 14021 / DFL 12) TaxID=398580 RepID=A8LLP3_DINSH|nr:DUF6778 family protein [Dinoroseobacter shibae]ABV93421.1 conserved hypothetical protein [Dinoroseobacter shibae DFL 12 = DSM 16493]URF48335.1 hypothetical protein M8008_08660 [Dinoroseobacter shibae]URF52645.1 hypothetical protein M8007_08660 [Dinoroseobacter shibae]
MRAFLILALSTFVLSACASQWQTDYAAPIPAEVSQNWRLAGVEVLVPETLTVSEDNVYFPIADIVWREEALTPGVTRYDQVDAIVTDGITRGASGLSGSQAVKILATVGEFHALSEIARYGLSTSAVHNIAFAMQVVDARTGAALSEPTMIQADFPALLRDEAIQAETAGQTQRVRITDHIAKVTAGYLGIGPDMRNSFVTIGQ